MTMNFKPVFKKKEIIIEYPSLDGIILANAEKDIIAEVLYVGEAVENYKVGDKILFGFKEGFGKILEIGGKKLLRIEREEFVICQVTEMDESI